MEGPRAEIGPQRCRAAIGLPNTRRCAHGRSFCGAMVWAFQPRTEAELERISARDFKYMYLVHGPGVGQTG